MIRLTSFLWLWFQCGEDQPHIQGLVAAWAQEGLEELSHVEGQEGRQWGDTPSPRQGTMAALCWSSCEEIPHAQGKRNPSKMVGVARGHQRADTLKPYSQKSSQSNSLISSSNFLIISLIFSMYSIKSYENSESFTSFLIWTPFFFFFSDCCSQDFHNYVE